MKLFTIKNERVSGKAWGEVDADAIATTLKQAKEDNIDGHKEAKLEVYAVNDFGIHHEITKEDNIILNRGGLMEATAALINAGTELNLTDQQKQQAAIHLLRHYEQEEVNLQMPEALKKLASGQGGGPGGEMVRLVATICGEMAVEDIPLNPSIDISALKAGDDDPMEVVVEVPAGRSKRGWNYMPAALQKIVGEVMSQGLPGFLGHQKAEDVENQFPTPVTHWVGAKWDNGKAYFRGVVDSASKDLKRWIRAKSVREVSIFGMPTLQTVGGETQVVDYDSLSIDWTPLGRAGMPTRVVAIGEMDSISIKQSKQKKDGGVTSMTFAELMAELRKLGVKPAQVIGEMGWSDVKLLAKELGWKLDEVAGELNAERWKALQETVSAVGEMTQVFGLGKEAKLADLVDRVKATVKFAGEMGPALGLAADAKFEDVLASAKSAHESREKLDVAERTKILDEVVGEMVTAEAARPLVKRLFGIPEKADKEAVKKAVGEMLEQEDVKTALAGVFKDTVIAPKDGGDKDKNKGGSGGLSTESVPI